MLSVSADYTAAATATIRDPRARVTVTWTDQDIDQSIAASANDENRVTYTDQVADAVESVPYKWFHLSGDCKLTGDFHPMPNAGEDDDYQVGWWGADRCDGSAVWGTPYPTLTVTWDARPVNRLRVVGDDKYAEYPVDFTITLYNGVTLLHTETVTGNAAVEWVLDLSTPYNSVTEMRLAISKWSAASRVVKIVEVYTEVVEVYTDDILSLNLQEERELSDGSLPVGNISANELDLRLQNVDDRFFPGNTDSLLYTVIKAGRKIVAELGFVLPDGSIEYAALGTFWSGDWDVPLSGTHAGTAARDRMDRLRKMIYTSSDVYHDIDLYDLAEDVLTYAQGLMPDLSWSIAAALHDYEIEWAWFERKSVFDCLRDIAGACCGQVYMSREDVLTIVGPL